MKIENTCITFSSDVEIMGFELWEPFEPMDEKGVGILCYIHEVKNNSNKQNENLFNIELRMVIRD